MDPWAVAGLVFAFVVVLLGAYLLVLAKRQLAGIFLAAFLLLWGANGFTWIGMQMGVVPPHVNAVVSIFGILGRAAALLAFALVYPSLDPTGWRRRALFSLPLLLVASIAAALLWVGTGDGYMTRFFVFLSMASGFTYAVSLTLLGHRWLRSPPGPFRTQIAWGLIPILFWNLHDGLGFTIYPTLYAGQEFVLAGLPPAFLLGRAFALAGLVVGGAIWLVALSRVMSGSRPGDERAIAFVTLFLLPVTLFQVIPDGYPTDINVHVWVDNIIVFLFAYGVARYRVADIDLKLRTGLKGGTITTAFLAVFFVATEGAALVFGDLAQNALVGIVAAGALFFVFAPLQRAADRVAARAVPGTSDPDAYLAYRRVQIYAAALEGALREGVPDPRGSPTLARLRAELALNDEDHARIERDLRDRIHRAGSLAA